MNQQQSSAVNLAHHCISRLNTGEPQIAGAYFFEGADFCDYVKESKNTYYTPDGEICSLEQCAKSLGISKTFTITVFSRHNCDYELIFSRYGKNKYPGKYKAADGTETTAKEIADHYQCSLARVYRAFTYADGNYEKAHRKIVGCLNKPKDKAA